MSYLRNVRRYGLAALVVFCLVGAAAPSGCENPPPPPSPAGDLITGASLMAFSDASHDYQGAEVVAHSGQTIASAQPRISARADAGTLDRLVIMDFAINHVLDGSWSSADRWAYWQAMWSFPGCVVVGTVTHSTGAPTAAAIAAANVDLAQLVAERDAAGYPTVLVTTWAEAVAADPTLIQGAPDWYHFTSAASVEEYAAAVEAMRGAC